MCNKLLKQTYKWRKIFLIGLSLALSAPHLLGQIGEKGKMQAQVQANGFTVEKKQCSYACKNQARTGTCWSFSTTSLLEKSVFKNIQSETDVDLSEMFLCTNMYIEKQRIMFTPGKAIWWRRPRHDVIRAVATLRRYAGICLQRFAWWRKTLNHSQVVLELTFTVF